MFDSPEDIEEKIAIYSDLKLLLQKISRNVNNSRKIRNLAMEALDATRSAEQFYISQRDKKETNTSTRRNTSVTEQLETYEATL